MTREKLYSWQNTILFKSNGFKTTHFQKMSDFDAETLAERFSPTFFVDPLGPGPIYKRQLYIIHLEANSRHRSLVMTDRYKKLIVVRRQ